MGRDQRCGNEMAEEGQDGVAVMEQDAEEAEPAVFAFPKDGAIRQHLMQMERLCVERKPHFGLIWAFHSDQHSVDQGHFLYTCYYPWDKGEATMTMLVAAHWLHAFHGLSCNPLRDVMQNARDYRTSPLHVDDVEDAARRVKAIYEEMDTLLLETLDPSADDPWTGSWFIALEIPMQVHEYLGGESRGRIEVIGEGNSDTYPALATIREILQSVFSNAVGRRQRRRPTELGPDDPSDGEDLEGVSEEIREMERLQDEVDGLFEVEEEDDANEDGEAMEESDGEEE